MVWNVNTLNRLSLSKFFHRKMIKRLTLNTICVAINYFIYLRHYRQSSRAFNTPVTDTDISLERSFGLLYQATWTQNTFKVFISFVELFASSVGSYDIHWVNRDGYTSYSYSITTQNGFLFTFINDYNVVYSRINDCGVALCRCLFQCKIYTKTE